MEQRSSLTAPWDTTKDTPTACVLARSLTEDEFRNANVELNDTTYVDKYPQTDRYYSDPQWNGQTYSLHSFVPSKNAKPDEHGVFGFMKCRGCFVTIDEAKQRAEWLIRNADSYHAIQTTYTGRPFPVCANSRKFVEQTDEVDVKKKAVQTISEDIKQKREEARQEMKDIKEREQKLLDESKDDFIEDPLDAYTTLQVKKANLMFTYVTTMEKMKDVQSKIRKTFADISNMESTRSELKDAYIEKYSEARRSAGLPELEADDTDNWMRYLNDKYVDELGFDPYTIPE